MPEICRQSLVRHPVFSLVRLLVRPWPYRVAPAADESCGAHICPIPCWLCHLMSTHTLMGLQQMSQHCQYQSTARSLVPSGPFGLAEQGLLFFSTSSSSSKIFGLGGNAWDLLDFDHQSAAIICVDTIRYHYIPSVPSRLEGVKTRPEEISHTLLGTNLQSLPRSTQLKNPLLHRRSSSFC